MKPLTKKQLRWHAARVEEADTLAHDAAMAHVGEMLVRMGARWCFVHRGTSADYLAHIISMIAEERQAVDDEDNA